MYYNTYVHNLRHNCMRTVTATKARSNLFGLLKDISKKHLPTRVSHKDGAVIIIDEDDYESLLETAELSSDAAFIKSIKKADEQIAAGEVYEFDEIFND